MCDVNVVSEIVVGVVAVCSLAIIAFFYYLAFKVINETNQD